MICNGIISFSLINVEMLNATISMTLAYARGSSAACVVNHVICESSKGQLTTTDLSNDNCSLPIPANLTFQSIERNRYKKNTEKIVRMIDSLQKKDNSIPL